MNQLHNYFLASSILFYIFFSLSLRSEEHFWNYAKVNKKIDMRNIVCYSKNKKNIEQIEKDVDKCHRADTYHGFYFDKVNKTINCSKITIKMNLILDIGPFHPSFCDENNENLSQNKKQLLNKSRLDTFRFITQSSHNCIKDDNNHLVQLHGIEYFILNNFKILKVFLNNHLSMHPDYKDSPLDIIHKNMFNFLTTLKNSLKKINNFVDFTDNQSIDYAKRYLTSNAKDETNQVILKSKINGPFVVVDYDDKKIGEGGEKIIFKGLGTNGEIYAVGFYKKQPSTNEKIIYDLLYNEYDDDNANIVIPVLKDDNFIVTRYYSLGDLHSNMQGLSLEDPTQKIRDSLILDILKGIDALHKKNIFHNDLKLENVLLLEDEDNFKASIADFGLSRILKMPSDRIPGTRPSGTTIYYSPFHLKKMTKKYDLWSLGVLSYILINQDLPPWLLPKPKDPNYDKIQFKEKLKIHISQLEQKEIDKGLENLKDNSLYNFMKAVLRINDDEIPDIDTLFKLLPKSRS